MQGQQAFGNSGCSPEEGHLAVGIADYSLGEVHLASDTGCFGSSMCFVNYQETFCERCEYNSREGETKI